MRDEDKSRPELLDELSELRQQLARLKEAGLKKDGESLPEVEEALHRMNRKARAISACNQTLIRAEDEQALLNAVCNIVCDTAGYRMAWVGYLEHDAAKTVRPIAWGGFEDQYLATARITWADTELGGGPTGTAARKGDAVYIQDFATDLHTAPWRKSALARGYRSSIALPLKNKDRDVFGVLNIYSSEPDAFTPDEIGLLGELAKNLAFGITILRDRITQRRAEEALRESEEKYRNIYENAVEGIFQTTPEGRTFTVNPAFARMFGYDSPAEMTECVTDIARQLYLNPEDRKIFQEKLDAQGIVEGLEVEMRRKDGGRIWASLNARAVRDAAGRMLYYEGTAEDVTKRKETEEELRRSHAMYRTVFDNSGTSMIIIDENTNIVLCNEEWVKLSGYSREENEGGKSWTEFIHEEDLAAMRKYHAERRIDPSEIPRQYEFRFIDRNGKSHNMINTVAMIPGTKLSVAAQLDITDIKQAEAAIQERLRMEERLSRIAQAIPGTILEYRLSSDGSGSFTYVSPAGKNLFGVAPEAAMSDPEALFRLIHPDDVRARAQIAVSAENLTPYREEFRINHPEKGERWIEVHALPGRQPDDSVVWHGFAHDVTERKHAEEALYESEEKYRLIAENASDVIWAADLNMKFTYVSPSAKRIYGWTSEEIETLSLEQMMPPHSLEMVKRTLSEAVIRMKGGEPDLSPAPMVEIEVYRKDGTALWAEVAPRFVRDDEGRIKGLVGVNRDITKRKRAEEALRISEATLKSVIAAAPVGIVICEQNHIPKWANENMVAITGYVADDLQETGTSILYTSEEEHARVVAALQDGIRRSGVGITDTKWVHKNGAVRDVHLRASNIDPGDPGAGFVATAVDVTAQKLAEKALLESEEKYRSVVENSPVGFYIVRDGLFRYVNKRFCEITGYTYEDLVGKRGPLENVHPEDLPMMEENLRKRMAGEVGRIEYDFRGVRKDGRIVILRAIGTTTIYEGERAASGSILDITREKSLEDKLLQSQKMEALGTLAGGIAHDFNNILTALTGYGTLLRMKMDEADPLHVYVDQILSASNKAAQLTQGLLAFSRQQPIALSHVDINGLIRGTEKLLKRLLTEDIELRTSLASADITVMADATQIDQILFNLATNARDAMPRGGVLTITTEAVELDEGFRHVQGYGESGTYALLSISDTGVGMDKVTQEHIFDPFFTTKEVGKGTGLGLSTVYGVVKQHNGYITVYSEPNVGTTFHIYLPSVTREGVEERRVRIPAVGGHETILIAEDNEPVRALMSRVLTQYGYKTIEAVDGADAVERFRGAETIDLLLLDSVMPRMNGREAYNEIEKIKPGIKVIFTSGYTRDVFLDKGVEDREFTFLQKPISPDTLLRKVRGVLDGAKG